jgi:hypothetical protein
MNSGMIRNKKPAPTKVRTGFDSFGDYFRSAGASISFPLAFPFSLALVGIAVIPTQIPFLQGVKLF